MHLTSEPQTSVVVPLERNVAKNGPSGAWWVSVAIMPPVMPATIAKMSNSAVTIISARKRGTTRFLTGSTPRTCSASSSSRILRAPRSAVIAVPATPATMIEQMSGANSRIDARL